MYRLHTLLLVYLLLNYLVLIKESETYGPVFKSFGIIGSIISFIFLYLLLIPGSPASLSLPSYVALAGWLIIGLVFFVIRYPKIKAMNNDELNRLILNHSEDEVNDMMNEDKMNNDSSMNI